MPSKKDARSVLEIAIGRPQAAVAGDDILTLARRKLVPSEHVEQSWFMQRIALLEGRWPELGLRFSSQSGAKMSIGTATKSKAAGMRRQVPDVVIPVPRVPFHGLYIELKKLGEWSRPSTGQRDYQRSLIRQGYAVVECQGSDAAISVVEMYMRLTPWSAARMEEVRAQELERLGADTEHVRIWSAA